MTPTGKTVAFRAESSLRDAIEKAALFHGTNMSLLLKSWIIERLVAEGFATVEGQTDEQNQAGNEGVDRSDAEPAGVI
jgi:hypothetical protein